MERTEIARVKYAEMRQAVQQEIQERLQENRENADQNHDKSGISKH